LIIVCTHELVVLIIQFWKPQTPKGAFETKQNELADFFDTVPVSDTTGAKRSLTAGNKKNIQFICTMLYHSNTAGLKKENISSFN
jgi:hypothetical protein